MVSIRRLSGVQDSLHPAQTCSGMNVLQLGYINRRHTVPLQNSTCCPLDEAFEKSIVCCPFSNKRHD